MEMRIMSLSYLKLTFQIISNPSFLDLQKSFGPCTLLYFISDLLLQCSLYFIDCGFTKPKKQDITTIWTT